MRRRQNKGDPQKKLRPYPHNYYVVIFTVVSTYELRYSQFVFQNPYQIFIIKHPFASLHTSQCYRVAPTIT